MSACAASESTARGRSGAVAEWLRQSHRHDRSDFLKLLQTLRGRLRRRIRPITKRCRLMGLHITWREAC